MRLKCFRCSIRKCGKRIPAYCSKIPQFRPDLKHSFAFLLTSFPDALSLRKNSASFCTARRICWRFCTTIFFAAAWSCESALAGTTRTGCCCTLPSSKASRCFWKWQLNASGGKLANGLSFPWYSWAKWLSGCCCCAATNLNCRSTRSFHCWTGNWCSKQLGTGKWGWMMEKKMKASRKMKMKKKWMKVKYCPKK